MKLEAIQDPEKSIDKAMEDYLNLSYYPRNKEAI